MAKRRGQSAAALKALRKRFKLGEFAPKRGKRAFNKASKRRRKLATISARTRNTAVQSRNIARVRRLRAMRKPYRVLPVYPFTPFEIKLDAGR